ncbi:MAG: gliding motility-associated ABC transporter substrate-binding protein GldG [Flavobacteriales bacterium]|nr:gliding motility-associated ABC transporter substrate-binding protein GldG [Flavobacteriales bacterium]
MKRRQDLIQLVLGLTIIIGLNIVGSFSFSRLDLTTEKRYTLSKVTKDLLLNLDDIIYFKVYLEGEFPSHFKRLRNSTKEMLDEFKVYGGRNIQYEFIDPSANKNKKRTKKIYENLASSGLKPTSVEVQNESKFSQQVIFPGAIITYIDRQVPLMLLQEQMGISPEQQINNSIQTLEYGLANSIRKLAVSAKSRVAFIEGHGELTAQETASITKSLDEYYLVERITLNGQLNKLKLIDAIIIAKPEEEFLDKDKFIIDQFIMKGGKVMWLVESVSTNIDSLSIKGETMAVGINQNISDQLFKYGARVNTDIIEDLQCAIIPMMVPMKKDIKPFPWIYYPLITNTSFHPMVKNLNAIKCQYASSLDTVEAKGVKKTFLLRSSKYSRAVRAPLPIHLKVAYMKPNPAAYNDPYQNIALLLEGEFTSVFKNRLTKQISKDENLDYRETSKKTKMIVVSDGDIIRNEVYNNGDILPLGKERLTGQEYGNVDFFLNAMNYLTDNIDMLSVRSRELKMRLLDKTILEKHKLKWQLINTALPILLVISFGFLQVYFRKRKYS